MQEFIGKFTRFLFKNEDSGFYIALFRAEKTNEVDAHSFSVSSNIKFEIETKYKITVTKSTNLKYKNSFVLQNLQEIIPDSKKGIVSYLSSSKFPGIGKTVAEKIVDSLGDEAIIKIKNDPTVLDDKNFKLTKEKKKTIIDVLNSGDLDNKLIEIFQTHNLKGELMRKIIDRITSQLFFDKYYEDPFLMWIDYRYINFEETNQLAKALKFDQSKKEKYFILNQLKLALWDTGSTIISLSVFFNFLTRVHLITKQRYGEVLKELIDLDLVKTYDIFLTTTEFYNKEDFIVDTLNKLNNEKVNLKFKIEIKDYFDAKQKEAIKGCLESSVSIITGQPGTGKTEILKEILFNLSKEYNEHQMAILAPTGRAAYQISSKTNFAAKTIHLFLLWQGDSFKVNIDNQVRVKVLIVDEFSMVDTNLFHALLSGINFDYLEKIILIGDKDQIPSISEGYLLNDLINSKKFPVFLLENNYRQKNGSNIFIDANKINKGLLPLLNKPDCHFIESSKEIFLEDLETFFNKFYENYPIEEITILAPMYEGSIGIKAINSFVQNKIFGNTEQKSFIINNQKFYIGDKVIQLENDIKSDVFNGEIGYIENVVFFKEKIDFIVVDFPNNKKVKYDLAQWRKNINLAYAISIHKFQGSESNIVIMILFLEHSVLLTKKLLYTGMTRAKQNLVIIGEKSAIQKAIENDVDSNRRTNIQKLFNND